MKGKGLAKEKEDRIDRLYRREWNPRRVLAGYFSVYITEGMVRSIMIILPVYLLSGLFSLTAIETGFILILAYVPWHFKFLIGLGMDASPAWGNWRRRIFIISGTLITIAGVLWLAGTTSIWLGILPAIMLVMLGDALIDTGMDSLLLDVTPPEWHGTSTGVGWGARAIGYTISAGLTWFVQANWGWTAALFMFVLYSIPALLATLIKEPEVTHERKLARLPLAKTFTNKWILTWVGVAFFSCIVYVLDPTRGILSVVTNTIVMGSEGLIFQVTMLFGIGAIIASFVTGRVMDKRGHRKGLYIAIIGSFISVLLWSTLGEGMAIHLLAYSLLLGFFSAYNFVAWSAVLADTVPPHFTAFMWQFDMGWLHVAAFTTGIFITYMLGAGYQVTLLVMAILILVGLIPAKFIRSIPESKGEVS